VQLFPKLSFYVYTRKLNERAHIPTKFNIGELDNGFKITLVCCGALAFRYP